jgi:hypothetical protein
MLHHGNMAFHSRNNRWYHRRHLYAGERQADVPG